MTQDGTCHVVSVCSTARDMATVTGLRGAQEGEDPRRPACSPRSAVRASGVRPRDRRGDRGVVRRVAPNVLPVLRLEGGRAVRRQRRSGAPTCSKRSRTSARTCPRCRPSKAAVKSLTEDYAEQKRRAARPSSRRAGHAVAAHTRRRAPAGLGERHRRATAFVGPARDLTEFDLRLLVAATTTVLGSRSTRGSTKTGPRR